MAFGAFEQPLAIEYALPKGCLNRHVLMSWLMNIQIVTYIIHRSRARDSRNKIASVMNVKLIVKQKLVSKRLIRRTPSHISECFASGPVRRGDAPSRADFASSKYGRYCASLSHTAATYKGARVFVAFALFFPSSLTIPCAALPHPWPRAPVEPSSAPHQGLGTPGQRAMKTM